MLPGIAGHEECLPPSGLNALLGSRFRTNDHLGPNIEKAFRNTTAKRFAPARYQYNLVMKRRMFQSFPLAGGIRNEDPGVPRRSSLLKPPGASDSTKQRLLGVIQAIDTREGAHRAVQQLSLIHI